MISSTSRPPRRFLLLAVTRIPCSESESEPMSGALDPEFDERLRGRTGLLPLRFRFGASESASDEDSDNPRNISTVIEEQL